MRHRRRGFFARHRRECWDQVNPEPTIEQYRAWLVLRIEALNRALEGIDPARVRLHVCWGSWHGPHSTDIGFDDLEIGRAHV